MRTLTITLLATIAIATSGCGNSKPKPNFTPYKGNCRLSDGQLVLASDQTECEDYQKGTWEGD